MDTHNLVSGKLKKKKTVDFSEFYTSTRDTIMGYWSADTLSWQLSIDHEMELPYKIAKM